MVGVAIPSPVHLGYLLPSTEYWTVGVFGLHGRQTLVPGITQTIMNPTEELAAGMWVLDRIRITALLEAGADIDIQDLQHGETILVRAMFDRSLEWCTELLERGADPQVRNHYNKTVWGHLHPFYDIPFYSLFLQYGTDVNHWTALHWACECDHHPTIHLLLTEGADPRLPVLDGNDKGKTAYDMGPGTFWETPDGIRARLRWDTVSIQEVFILASERGLVPIPSYLW